MSEHKITVEGGTTARLLTAGKFCDRDILITATGGGGGTGDVGGLTQYAKLVAKPTTTTYFTVENPLGGIAKKITVRRLSDTIPSSRKIRDYIADLDTRMGALYAIATNGNARYVVTRADGSADNAEFSIKDGTITLYRFNSANTWDTSSEYEIEIWQ